MNKPAIKCLYTCKSCGVLDRPVQMTARGDETAAQWIRDVCAPAISRDHDNYSPHCTQRTMTNLKIPVTEGRRIGDVGGNEPNPPVEGASKP